jgi:predicted class III extradiol MEMO1 family dioxygenase
MIQKYTSAKSSIKQVPAGFKIVDKYFGWQPNTVNLDIGGGKYDLMTEALKEKGVTNLIFDPYNKSQKHNEMIISMCRRLLVDTVTIFNVLNVIKEYEMQINVLNLALEVLKDNGMVFIRSTYMNRNKASGVTKSGTFQHYKTQKEYLEIVKKVFPDAELKHGIIFAKK